VALRYNDPDSIDVGIADRFMVNTTNGETGYRSGTAYVNDFTAGWNFGK
jgi:hypothetical protein